MGCLNRQTLSRSSILLSSAFSCRFKARTTRPLSCAGSTSVPLSWTILSVISRAVIDLPDSRSIPNIRRVSPCRANMRSLGPPLDWQQFWHPFRRKDLDRAVDMGKIFENRVQLAPLGVDQPGEFGAFGDELRNNNWICH